jgi:hypothetical protein
MKNTKNGLILIINFLFTLGCYNGNEKLIYLKDGPVYEYSYYIGRNGILKMKMEDDHTELILYNTCLEQVDKIDNFNYNAFVGEISGWTDSTINVYLQTSESDWEQESLVFKRLNSQMIYLGQYRIKYNYEFCSNGGSISNPDTIDMVKFDCQNLTLELFNHGEIKEETRIEDLYYCNDELVIKIKIGKSIEFKKIYLTNGLTSKGVLKDIFSAYKKSYCK